MKQILSVLIYLFISSVCYPQLTYNRITDDLTYLKLDDSTFIINHKFPFSSNSLFVLCGNKEAVLIDTPNEESGTNSLLNWISDTFGILNIKVINSGFHNVNLGGNFLLNERGYRIYGSGLCYRLVKSQSQKEIDFLLSSTKDLPDKKYYNAYKEMTLIPPNDTFPINSGLHLHVNNLTFDVYFPGDSHTKDNLVIYIPEKKILFGGCMILSIMHRRPGYIKDANMTEWPVSVQNVVEKYPDIKTVIPGHGLPGNSDLLYHTIDILNRWNLTH